MSFGDVLGTLFHGFLGLVQKKESRIERQMEKYECLDTKTLIQEYKSSSGDAKLAAALVLKERKSSEHR